MKLQDKARPLSVIWLCDFHISLVSVPQIEGTVCCLEGEGRTYHLHDDNTATVEA